MAPHSQRTFRRFPRAAPWIAWHALAVAYALLGSGCVLLPYADDPLYRPVRESLDADHANFYTPKTLSATLLGFGAAAALAHSHADENLRQQWQDDVHGQPIDGLATGWSNVGEGEMVGIALAAYAAGTYAPQAYGAETSRTWGERNIRALVVGAPPLVAGQLITGGSRPGESSDGSRWNPFSDTNGVSGHAFMGAVPFITAAQMSDSLAWKAAFYGASALPGAARIHEDQHYASQVLLGWMMAYLACDAVTATQEQRGWVEVVPLAIEDGVGVGWVVAH